MKGVYSFAQSEIRIRIYMSCFPRCKFTNSFDQLLLHSTMVLSKHSYISTARKNKIRRGVVVILPLLVWCILAVEESHHDLYADRHTSIIFSQSW